MPPRQQQRPPGNSRRRQAPVVPNGLFVLLVMAAVVAVIVYANEFGSSQTVNYGDFVRLLDAHQLSSVVVIGEERIKSEVRAAKDMKDWPEAIKDLYAYQGKKIATSKPKVDDKGELYDMLTKEQLRKGS